MAARGQLIENPVTGRRILFARGTGGQLFQAETSGAGASGGPAPNAADLQVGTPLRLPPSAGDLRPLLDRRPAATVLAERWFADFPGKVPAGALPQDWLSEAAR